MGVKVREKVKGSGEWWIYINHQGKRKAKKVGRSKKAALDVAKKVEAKLVLGQVDLDDKPEKSKFTLKDCAEIWLNVTVPAICKESTQTDYKSIVDNHILPVIGDEEVSAITRLQIKTLLLEKIKDGLSPSTVSHIKSCISGMMNIAVDNGEIDTNPAHRLGKLFRKDNTNNRINPYSKEELALLLQAFQKYRPEHLALVLLLARTGVRLGEAFGLQWGDVNFEERLICINRTYSCLRLGTPKNGKTRMIDMSKQLTQTLTELKKEREKEVENGRWKKLPAWIFVNNAGNPLDSNGWRKRVFYKVLEKANLRKIRIHDIRHSYASLLIQAGESLAYIRDQLGHHSISVTVDIYGHLEVGRNKIAVDGLDDEI